LIAAARLRRDPLRRRKILDAVVPAAALGIAIGRLGEFLDGQGQGLPSALPWATQFTNRLAATPDFGVPRHPAQLYDALVLLALFGLVRVLPRQAGPGTRFAAFLVMYGCGRLLLAAVRLDPAFLFGLQIEQLLALGAVAFGLGFGIRPLVTARVERARLRTAAARERARTTTEGSLAV
jgi:phosphatidylglycerol:prolipoprotein diacylglycerol transferase